ncbi:hypothetical protein [Mesobacillus maritimus]|uniref:hypothetical protein n=1 Tax=Mesobacillus maritimus TaxID=1643336 RepID=UPI00384C1E94
MINIDSKVVKVYSVLIALLPIISIYSSGIPGVNLGEILLIAFLAYSVLLNRRVVFNPKHFNSIILFGWFIVMTTLIAMFFDSSQIADVFVRTVRFTFYLLIIYYLSKKYFSIDYTSKIIKNVSILATIYILIQNISYNYFGIILKGFLPFIPVYTSHYETYDYASIYNMLFYRPTSFFLEPAHYSQYALIGLVVLLYKEKFNMKNIISSIFLTTGILISTSGQGLILAAFLWVLYAVYILFSNTLSKQKRLFGMIFPILLLVILPFILQSDVVQNNISRILASGTGTAFAARAEGYFAFGLKDNIFTLFFGAGFGNTPEGIWYSSLAYLLYCTGIIGLVFFVGILLMFYINAKNLYTKMLIILCFGLSASAEIIHSFWVVLILSLICYSNHNVKIKVRDNNSIQLNVSR